MNLAGLWHEPHEEQWQKLVFSGEMASVCPWLGRDIQEAVHLPHCPQLWPVQSENMGRLTHPNHPFWSMSGP